MTSKWIFNIKNGADGSVEKHKGGFVARGFFQKEGVDYDETFSPVDHVGHTKHTKSGG